VTKAPEDMIGDLTVKCPRLWSGMGHGLSTGDAGRGRSTKTYLRASSWPKKRSWVKAGVVRYGLREKAQLP
jgi:hypothetical protein